MGRSLQNLLSHAFPVASHKLGKLETKGKTMIDVKPLFCPRLKGDDTGQCAQRVTSLYFKNFCNTQNFKGCRRYAEIMKELNTPMQWLQDEAMTRGGAKREGKNNL